MPAALSQPHGINRHSASSFSSGFVSKAIFFLQSCLELVPPNTSVPQQTQSPVSFVDQRKTRTYWVDSQLSLSFPNVDGGLNGPNAFKVRKDEVDPFPFGMLGFHHHPTLNDWTKAFGPVTL